jgi:hypothetical protein
MSRIGLGILGQLPSKAQVRKSTWKKRARASPITEGVGSTTNSLVLRGKRVERDVGEHASDGDEGKKFEEGTQ